LPAGERNGFQVASTAIFLGCIFVDFGKATVTKPFLLVVVDFVSSLPLPESLVNLLEIISYSILFKA
jgi:hypothetical protein